MTPARLLEQFNTVKTLPHVAIRLIKLISDENSSIREFEEIIKMDPTLVLRLLRTVNSSYYGLHQKVDSISRAVVFVGMKNLRNMVVTEALKDVFEENAHNHIFSKSRLWLHCVAVSVCSQMIAERIFTQNSEDVFLCGILHDVGMIVENQVANDLFIKTCKAHEPGSRSFTEIEKEVIGTDHAAVGRLLARNWKLPVEIQEGIWKHHREMESVSPTSITGIIQMAEYIVSRLNYAAMPGMDAKLSPPLRVHISDNILEYKTLIQDIPGEMSNARDIYAFGGDKQHG